MAAMLWTPAIFIVLFLGASTSFQIAPYFYDLRAYFGFCGVIWRQSLPHKLHSPSTLFRKISAWTKCGHICLFRPFWVDLTVAMDVEINSGPDALEIPKGILQILFQHRYLVLQKFFLSCCGYASNSQEILSSHSVQSCDVFLRSQLCMEDTGSSFSLTGNNKFKWGCRAGRKVKERWNYLLLNIPIVKPCWPSRNTSGSHSIS